MLLHDHLDGGVRPGTVAELAAAAGHRLPVEDPDRLATWFRTAAIGGDLESYLAAFRHTVGVMQTTAALSRVAREAVEDLAADGIVYAELRFAPELHTQRGLGIDDVVETVTAEAAEAGARAGVEVRLILAAMRTDQDVRPTARLAVRWRDAGVVGFDLAGAEAGHPAEDHADAVALARDGGVHVTIHAGEAAGPDSVASALRVGAERIGHGVRIVEDVVDDGLGPVARQVRDERLLLEVCPTSNLDTGVYPTMVEHPVDRLRRLGFRVSVNTDNRLMSGVSLSSELAGCVAAFGWGHDDLERMTLDALDAAFCDAPLRVRLRDRVIGPGFRARRADDAGS